MLKGTDNNVVEAVMDAASEELTINRSDIDYHTIPEDNFNPEGIEVPDDTSWCEFYEIVLYVPEGTITGYALLEEVSLSETIVNAEVHYDE